MIGICIGDRQLPEGKHVGVASLKSNRPARNAQLTVLRARIPKSNLKRSFL